MITSNFLFQTETLAQRLYQSNLDHFRHDHVVATRLECERVQL